MVLFQRNQGLGQSGPESSGKMNIHEYQSKALLAGYGVATPKGGVAFTPEEAVTAAKELGGPVWVVKAQIHAGGRGKGGGCLLYTSPSPRDRIASRMPSSA